MTTAAIEPFVVSFHTSAMSSRPQLAILEQKIEQMGGEDVIFERIADGESIGKIATSLGYSRPMLYTWRDHKPHDERRKEKWAVAQKSAAESFAEDGLTILEDLAAVEAVTPAQVQIGNSRSNYLRWLAGVRDRETYGDKAGPVLQLNVQSLHLDALRIAGSMTKPALPSAPIQEAEIVDEAA